MALFFSNDTYQIKNGASRSDDKEYLSLDTINGEKVIVLAEKEKATKWILRDQGFAGPEHQLVSLQRRAPPPPPPPPPPPVEGLGFFYVEKPTDGTPVKYSQLASVMKLEESSDDLVTVRFTKGAVSLLLTAPAGANNTQVTVNNHNTNDNARQQWLLEKVDKEVDA